MNKTFTIKPIINVKILGQTYFYDEEQDLVGFPKKQAKAIVQRVLEQIRYEED